MPLAEHSDLYLRGELTVESLHYGQGKSHQVAKFLHSLSDVGSFNPSKVRLAELKPPQESGSKARMPASLFVPLDSEKSPVTRVGQPIMRLSGGRRLGDFHPMAHFYEFKQWMRLAISVEEFDRPPVIGFAKRSEGTEFQVSEDAQNRLRGHESLFRTLLFITGQEAAARHVQVRKIEALPAWSHEYEDDDGVVIHVEVQGSDEERFSVWEGISERINLLQDNLNSKDSEFLMNEVSVIVDRQ